MHPQGCCLVLAPVKNGGFRHGLLGLGVLGSFIASILFLAGLFLLRPKLRLSDQISKTTLHNQSVFCIKVVNDTWRDAVNLRAELVIVQPDRVPGGIASRIAPISLLKDSLFVLRRRNAFEPHPTFAFRFITAEDIPSLWETQEDRWKQHHQQDRELRPYVQFVLFAQDSVSNLGKVFAKKYYSLYHTVISGEFEHGGSLDISSQRSDRGDV